MIATVSEHHGRGSKALAQVLRLEHVIVDIFRRHFRGDARAARGLRDHEVVDACTMPVAMMTIVVMKTGRIIGMTMKR